MEIHEIALRVLSGEYNRIAGEIFADYFARIKGSDELRKSIEANDFLIGMLNGNIKKEWKLEESDKYKKLINIVHTINFLGENIPTDTTLTANEGNQQINA